MKIHERDAPSDTAQGRTLREARHRRDNVIRSPYAPRRRSLLESETFHYCMWLLVFLAGSWLIWQGFRLAFPPVDHWLADLIGGAG